MYRFLLIILLPFILQSHRNKKYDLNLAWRNASLKSIWIQKKKVSPLNVELKYYFNELERNIKRRSNNDQYQNIRKNFVNFWLAKRVNTKTDSIFVFEVEEGGERNHLYNYVEIKHGKLSDYFVFNKNNISWSVKSIEKAQSGLIEGIFNLPITYLKTNLFDSGIVSFNRNSFKIVTLFNYSSVDSKVFIYPNESVLKRMDANLNLINKLVLAR